MARFAWNTNQVKKAKSLNRRKKVRIRWLPQRVPALLICKDFITRISLRNYENGS